MKITKRQLKEIIREELENLTEAKTELSKSEKSAFINKGQLPTWYILIKMEKQKKHGKWNEDWNKLLGSVGMDFIKKKKSWSEDQFYKIMPEWIPGTSWQDIFSIINADETLQTVDQMWTESNTTRRITKQQLKEIIREELVSVNEDAEDGELTDFERSKYIRKKILPTWYIAKKVKKQKSELENKFGLGNWFIEYILKNWKRPCTAAALNKAMPPWVPKEKINDLFDKSKDSNLPQV